MKMLKLDSLSQQDLAARLTLNCVNSYVEPQKVNAVSNMITIIDVFDDYALSSPVREEIYKFYPQAKLAHLKSGGNFPYLSRSDEVNLHLQIHLGRFQDSEFSALDKGVKSKENAEGENADEELKVFKNLDDDEEEEKEIGEQDRLL